jgi:hypothetical protein
LAGVVRAGSPARGWADPPAPDRAALLGACAAACSALYAQPHERKIPTAMPGSSRPKTFTAADRSPETPIRHARPVSPDPATFESNRPAIERSPP